MLGNQTESVRGEVSSFINIGNSPHQRTKDELGVILEEVDLIKTGRNIRTGTRILERQEKY